jgi:hypothetical protein
VNDSLSSKREKEDPLDESVRTIRSFGATAKSVRKSWCSFSSMLKGLYNGVRIAIAAALLSDPERETAAADVITGRMPGERRLWSRLREADCGANERASRAILEPR